MIWWNVWLYFSYSFFQYVIGSLLFAFNSIDEDSDADDVGDD